MNWTNDSAVSPPLYVNPLIFILAQEEIRIQPYWLVAAQLVALQLLERVYNWCSYKTFHTSIEIAWYHVFNDVGRGDKDKGVQLNWFDLFLTLSTTAQTVWICIEQKSCKSLSAEASSWDCYNMFGYKLHNYVMGSIINLTIKIFLALVGRDDDDEMTCTEKLCLRLLIPQFVFMGGLGLAFLITHILPMLIIHIWLLIILIAALLLVNALLIPVVCLFQCSCDSEYIMDVFLIAVLAWFPLLFAILYSTLFNYSQYFYYKENYLTTIKREYDSRNTFLFFKLLTKSLSQKGHTILSFL